MNTILEGSSLPDVMHRPRVHHQLMPMELEYETDFNMVRYIKFTSW